MKFNTTTAPARVTEVTRGAFSLNFAASDDAAEIDRGIRDTITGMRLSIMATGLALARVKAGELYTELGFTSISQYIQKLCGDTKMEQRGIFTWLYIGEAYLKYRKELERVGFTDDDGPTKLPYIEQALLRNQKKKVFSNLKKMSVREFIQFSKGTSGKGEEPYITMRGGRLYVDGSFALKINKRLDRETYTYLRKVYRIVGKAMEDGEFILPIRLRNMDELRRYESASGRILSNLRKAPG